MMFRRFLSPRYTVVALAVALTFLLSDHLTTAQPTTSPAASPTPTTSGATPAPSAMGTGVTTSPSGTTASDEETSGTDDSEPGESFLDCSTDNAGDGHCDDSNNTEVCGYDGGDCCECTCEATSINNCGGDYNCIDPDAPCVNDDDGNGGTESINDDVTGTDASSEGDEEDVIEGDEGDEGNAASGLFSASCASVITATLAAVGLALC